MKKLATIEIRKQQYHFSCAHFTIFSATERERLHGHNFHIGVTVTSAVDENGLCFDYAIFKKYLSELCQRYDEYTLIAEKSPHLKIKPQDQYYLIEHHDTVMKLLQAETLLLPIANITIEELSHYLLSQIVQESSLITDLKIHNLAMHVSSGSDQWASAVWEQSDG